MIRLRTGAAALTLLLFGLAVSPPARSAERTIVVEFFSNHL